MAKLERDLDRTIETLSSADTLDFFKAQLPRLLNSGPARLLIHAYVPKELRDAELLSLITTVGSSAN